MKQKKMLAILMTVMMVLTMMPLGVFADADETVSNVEEQVEEVTGESVDGATEEPGDAAIDKPGDDVTEEPGDAVTDEPEEEVAGESATKGFADMPNNWSTSALEKAVANGLLKGYAEGDKLLIKATAPIKRAEMAAVVNRAFGAVKKAGLGGVTDVAATSWYADDIAKAVMMGTFMKDNKMRPEDGITRQEAFTVLARAFKITSEGTGGLNSFTDKGQVAAWAENSLSAMVTAGYVQGSGGKINPKANISRAEFAVVMDNLVKQYIVSPGEVTEVVTKGNVLVRSSDVTLRNVTINGDLIIADGVGEGDVTLDGVTVTGRTVVRGGGENSIVIKGNSDLGKVIVYKVDGKVRIAVQGGADVEIIYIEDGSDDVKVEGTIGTLEVGGSSLVTTSNATITTAILSGEGASLILGSGTTVKNGEITGNASGITVDKGATVENIIISGDNAKIGGSGTVKTVEVKEGADGASVTTPNTKVVDGKEEVTTPPATGGGGGGNSSANKVSAITITPSIDVTGGVANGANVVLTMTTPTDGAKIYYTKDGSAPSEDSPEYDGGNKPVIDNDNLAGATITVRAKAFKSGMNPSDEATINITFKVVGYLQAYWDAVAEVEALDEDDYTTPSWALYEAAMVGVNLDLDENDAQGTIEDATDAINTALAILVKTSDVDTETYDAAVAQVQALNEEDYSDGWNAIEALDLTLTAKDGQAALDAEVTAIQNAIAGLVREDGKSNTILYDAAVAKVPADNDDDTYTTPSWTAFEAAIALADLTLTEDNEQVDINAATTAINNALGLLVETASVDTSAYAAKVAEVNALVKADYTNASWTLYEAAIGECDLTLTAKAGQAAIDNEVDAIQAALDLLVEKADLTDYNAALAAVDEKDYTEDSWEDYQLVVTANVVTAEDSQEDVNDATAAIIAAQADLVFAGQAALDAAKAAAAALDEEDYTEESWEALTDALALPETTNAEVVAKTTAINDAIDELEEAEVVDKSALTTAVTNANTNKGTAVVSEDGTDVDPGTDWVTQAVMDAYTTAIATAQAVLDNAGATQQDVDDAVTALGTATTTFNAAKADGTQREVESVEVLADINVANGTAIGGVSLPAKVDVTLDDTSVVNLSVAWDGGTPAYDGNTAGTYTFAGTLTMADTTMANTANVKASVKVVVAKAQYTVTFDVNDGNGTLTAEVDGVAIDDGDAVEEGKDVVFTATPDAGYQVRMWKKNNVLVGGNTTNNLTVENLAEDTVVIVEFQAIPVEDATLVSPKDFDLNAPADVTSAVTLNDATAITGIVNGVASLVEDTDYTFDGTTLTIKQAYLEGLSANKGDTITLVVSFDEGNDANLVINVIDTTPANNAPTVKAGQDTQSGNATPASNDGKTAAVPYTGDASGWFEDADVADTLTYELVSAVDGDSTDVSGDVTLNANTGAISYTAAAAQAEKTVTIVVKANDGTDDSTGNVTITVTVGAVPADQPVNNAPTVKAGQDTQSGNATPASNDGKTAAVPYTGDASGWFEDADVADTLTYELVSAVDGDSTDVSGDVTLDVNTGEISYTAAAAQAGKEVTIVVKANDGTDDSTGNVTITVTVGAVPADQPAANNAPTVVVGEDTQTGAATPASNDGITPAVDYEDDVSAWFEDADVADTLTYAIVSAKDDADVDVSADVTLDVNTGEISYTAAAAQAGKEVTIVVKANDGTDDSTGNVTITVTVGAVPADQPAANNAPTVVVGEDTQTGAATPASNDGITPAVDYEDDVSAWFEDADVADTLTYAIVSAKDDADVDVSADVTLDVNTGAISYTAAAAQAEKTVTIVVKANDGTDDSTGNVTITVTVGAVPADKSTDATVTSATYTVSTVGGGSETITNVPFGTAKATFLAALTKGNANQTWDDLGIQDPVVTNDTLEVTAEDGTTKITYTVTVNAARTGKAITATTVGTLDSGNIIAVPAGTKVSALKAGLTVSDGATAEILASSGGDAVADQENTDVTATMVIKVTAEDGSSAEYTIAME